MSIKDPNQRVQIGPRIPRQLKQRLEMYHSITELDIEVIVEMALTQFLQDKDMTPVVQLQLVESFEVTYDDPRFATLKTMLEHSRKTQANSHGRGLLAKKIQSEYVRVLNDVGMCPELKLEYEEALKVLAEVK